jgi:hypothetical protein
MGAGLNDGMMELSEWMLFAFAFGSLIFSMACQNKNGDFSFGNYIGILIVTIILSFLQNLMPMEEINKKLFKIKVKTDEKPLDQVFEKFKTVS